MDAIQVKCRKCDRLSDANSFVLDPIEKMMICPNCVKARKKTSTSSKLGPTREEIEKAEEPQKPAGWDAEDDYLEKAYRMKQNAPKFRMLEGSKLQCLECNYVFKFDRDKHVRPDCPYCGTKIIN